MRIALIGTRGVPARYGGFETCVEEVGRRLVESGHSVTVYCRSHPEDDGVGAHYAGMTRVVLPAVRRRALETLSHTAVSVVHAVTRARPDAAIVFNAANAPLLPLLRARGIPVATHVDGLEWRRAKWGPFGQRYYRQAEAAAVRWSDAVIADAPGIARYYRERFDATSVQIAYGAPTVQPRAGAVQHLDLMTDEYHLVVARFEPENHVLEVVRGFAASVARWPLVVVGSAPYADAYTESIREAADGRVRLMGGVWDQDLLDQLYAHSGAYWHGHSVGGTNPSLLRAMGAGASVNAFDIDFNVDLLGDDGSYWSTPESVAELVTRTEAEGSDAARQRREAVRVRARAFDWDDVASAYAELCASMARRDPALSPRGARRARRHQAAR